MSKTRTRTKTKRASFLQESFQGFTRDFEEEAPCYTGLHHQKCTAIFSCQLVAFANPDELVAPLTSAPLTQATSFVPSHSPQTCFVGRLTSWGLAFLVRARDIVAMFNRVVWFVVVVKQVRLAV